MQHRIMRKLLTFNSFLSAFQPENSCGSNGCKNTPGQQSPVVLNEALLTEVLIVHGDADDAETRGDVVEQT